MWHRRLGGGPILSPDPISEKKTWATLTHTALYYTTLMQVHSAQGDLWRGLLNISLPHRSDSTGAPTDELYSEVLCSVVQFSAVHYVFRSIGALHSFRLKLCSVKCIVQCSAVVQCSLVQSSVVQYSAVQLSTHWVITSCSLSATLVIHPDWAGSRSSHDWFQGLDRTNVDQMTIQYSKQDFQRI